MLIWLCVFIFVDMIGYMMMVVIVIYNKINKIILNIKKNLKCIVINYWVIYFDL